MFGCEESLYRKKQNSQSSYRPPALITSTAFDNDETFATVAKALLFRYEQREMSERDAINETLVTSEEKRAFMEALDLRHAAMFLNQDEELEEGLVNDLVQRTRCIFGASLKQLWRESIVPDSESESEFPSCEEEFVLGIDGHEYRQPLKTPKNLHSPITSSTMDSLPLALRPKSSGKSRRRTFFPDSAEQPRVRSRIRLDFNFSGAQQVESLVLDGLAPPLGSYAPPSPIRARTVSS